MENKNPDNATPREWASYHAGLSVGKFVGYWQGIKHSMIVATGFIILYGILDLISKYLKA